MPGIDGGLKLTICADGMALNVGGQFGDHRRYRFVGTAPGRWFLHCNNGTGIRLLRAGDDAEARQLNGMRHTGSLAQNFTDLVHHRGRAAQGCAVRGLDIDEEIALILVRQKGRRGAS
jgi:hypothetical protein